MAEYLAPGVYVEDIKSAPVIESVSTSTGGFIGMAQRGPLNTPVYITSWNAYINNFAYGMLSPFIADSDLAYAVYGFFQNGGKRCYVMRVASDTAKVAKATFTPTGEETYPTIQAKDAGAWANSMKMSIAANEDNASNFDITITLNSDVVETFTNVSNTTTDDNYWIDLVNSQSNFIIAVTGDLHVTSTDGTFSGGADGVDDVDDADFTSALSNLDTLDDLNLLAIPGQTSDAVNKALMSYCEGRGDVFALMDAPKASTVESVRTLRKTMSCKNGALFFPWIRVTDPLSSSGKLRDCPSVGHVMGVYARIINERGVWKAPAGTEANVRGAIEVLTTVTTGDLEALNPAGIISIMPKTNYGIVIWGARDLHPDSSMKYVTDVLLDTFVKKSVYEGTQSFVFEPNDQTTWTQVTTTVQTFLDGLWRDGAFKGETAAEAYYVKCDEDLNTEAVINQGQMICEVGYANKKPAEFVIFRFSHSVAEQ